MARALAVALLALAGHTVARAQSSDATPPDVEVRARRPAERAGETRVGSDELSRVPGSGGDPLRGALALPGLASTDDANAAPAVRGARPRDNAYLVDGLPIGYVFHGGGLVSVFEPDLLHRFDLYSAAWGPQYPDVLGGVFDLSLRNPRRDRIGGKLSMSLLAASALVEGPIGDDLSFFLSARRSYIDLIAKPITDSKQGTSSSFPEYWDTQGRLLWQLNGRNRLRLDLNAAHDDIKFTVNPDSRLVQQDPVLVGNTNLRASFRNTGLVWESDPAPNLSNRLSLGQLSSRQFFRIGAAGSYDLRTRTDYLREQARIDTGAHQIVLGGALSWNRSEIGADILNPRCTEFDPNCDLSSAPRTVLASTERQRLFEMYASDRWQFARAWALSAGLRHSRDDYLNRSHTDPRLALEHAWSDNTVVSMAYGKHHQMPDAEQIVREAGNSSLRYLGSRQIALGVTQRLAEGWSWRAEIYQKRFDDLVVAEPLLNYVNGASGSARGLELLVKRDGPSRWTGFFSLSASHASRRVEATGQRFAFDFDQPIVAHLVTQYRIDDRWSVGAKWTYHSGNPDTPIVGTTRFADGRVRPVYGGVNSERLPAYHRLDLRADWRVSPNLTAFFEVLNVYNRRNVAGYSYSGDYSSREPVYQLPLLPSVGVEYRF